MDRSGAGEAVARQREDALELAERRGWTVTDVFEDNDVSASGKRTRAGFEKMLSALKDGGVSAVVSWNLDRLTRNRRDTVRLIETCQAHNVTIALVRGSDLDMSTPSGRLVADVLASVARAEIETKGDRQKRANLQRAKAGKPHAGRRAFGYNKTGAAPVINEAELVRQGFTEALKGASLRSIARQWNTSGTTSTAGNPWRPDSVRGVLLNQRYGGRRVYRGEDMGEGTWPAIVSAEDALAVRAILSDPSRSTTDQREPRYLLTSIAECGRCDDGAKVATSRTQHGSRIYKCTQRGDLARKADPIDELVTELIIARLSQPDAQILALDGESPVPGLMSDLDAQRGRLDASARLFGEGTITASQLATITTECRDRIERGEAEIARITRGNTLAEIMASGDVRAAWEAMGVSQRRQVVGLLFARIVLEPVARGARTFDPESIRIEWRMA